MGTTGQEPGTADGGHWFEPLAAHLGSAYLRYSFTKGTDQEVGFLVSALGLSEGARVLDVGCGPGRHAHALAKRGMIVHGVDISAEFVEIARDGAPPGATFERADARELRFDREFDAVICLCQGAFGLMTEPGGDLAVLDGITRAATVGGRVALSAFNAFFVVKHWEGAGFNPDDGINHEHTEIRNPRGEQVAVDMWTGCYTPRELRLLFSHVGLDVDDVFGVEPGAYARSVPSVDLPEYLVLATRPDHAQAD